MDETARRKLQGTIARAKRASESPYEMTRRAREARWDRLRAQALAANPDLSDAELERAVRLLMRAEMARLQLKRWPKRS